MKKRGYVKRWRGAHREQFRAMQRQQRHALKLKLLVRYSGKDPPECVKCRFSDVRALSIDHIVGGGQRHMKRIGAGHGGTTFYRWLNREGLPEGYQTLCMNCQFIK